MSEIFVKRRRSSVTSIATTTSVQSLPAAKAASGDRGAIAPELDQLGEIAGGELYSLQLADRENEPT